MPDEALESVLRMLADGRLTAEEAGPIIDALGGSGPQTDGVPGASEARPDGATTGATTDDSPARALRVLVTEHGRAVINLRIPLSLGRAAITRVPGISDATSDRIREAIEAGIKGPILDVDDAGDGVRISIE
ncbi:MAG: hypothetical protein ACJ779_09460 [Chloroflexota bacterium]